MSRKMWILSALNDLLRKYCIDTDNSDPSPVYSVIISLRLFFLWTSCFFLSVSFPMNKHINKFICNSCDGLVVSRGWTKYILSLITLSSTCFFSHIYIFYPEAENTYIFSRCIPILFLHLEDFYISSIIVCV